MEALKSPWQFLALALFSCAMDSNANAAELTIDRLFDGPSLSGPTVIGLKISPDGSRVTYLQGKSEKKDRLDLWEYNIQDGKARVLVDSAALAPSKEGLSEEEVARRERQRTASLSGILEYSYSSSGRAVLFSLDGNLFYYDLTKNSKNALLQITQSPSFVTDPAVSPQGNSVAYVRDQNLFIYDLVKKRERALTSDGGGSIKNGMAEFIAQEEMDRSTGYWWAPDDAHIAFARIDETPVQVTQRFEIAADNVTTFSQRYPAAGGRNVLFRLGVIDVHTGYKTWIDLGADTNIYLARVNWLPDGKTLAVQVESRNQKLLKLLFADIKTGETRTVLTETSSSWIDLNDELTFLQKTNEFIWASSRDGFLHLYLYDYEGHLVRRLTAGKWDVNDFRSRAIKAVDEERRLLYFTATEKSPVERQFYATSLDNSDPQTVNRISIEDGLHNVSMSPNAKFYVDSYNSAKQPPQISLRGNDGRLLHFLIENALNDGHPDAPYITENSVPEFGTLPAADGQLLQYRLFKPVHFQPTKRYPAIVDVYGGPGTQRVLNNWSGDSFTQILTRAGYVVFQLDNRGSAFRGTSFQAPIHGQLGDVEVSDQVLGARWLGARAFIDPQRIGLWGWSYGGYMTLMLMFKAPDVFSAGIAGAPVTDWALYDTHYTERYLGMPQDNLKGYEASSVLPYANNIRGKLLIIHGMADDNVLFLHSTKLFRKLQEFGKPFEIMVYPGAKHGLLRESDGRHAYATMLEFFNQMLRP